VPALAVALEEAFFCFLRRRGEGFDASSEEDLLGEGLDARLRRLGVDGGVEEDEDARDMSSASSEEVGSPSTLRSRGCFTLRCLEQLEQ